MTFEEKTISSERIYEGKIINLRKDKVEIRDGGTSFREIVEHNGAAVIIGVTVDNKIPMVTQFRKAAEREILEIPAGRVEKDEDPKDAALRELREETGYSAGRIEHLVTAYSSIGYSTELLHFYLATNLTLGDTEFDRGESIDISEYPLEELYEMSLNGKIIDQKTIVAILMTYAKLKND